MTAEQHRQLVNKAWQLFNAALNTGKSWDAAKAACLEDVKTQQDRFDGAFVVNEADPLHSEAVWNIRMDQFFIIKQTLEQIT
jgi:hypothetical protein